jgi:hypothetical protein
VLQVNPSTHPQLPPPHVIHSSVFDLPTEAARHFDGPLAGALEAGNETVLRMGSAAASERQRMWLRQQASWHWQGCSVEAKEDTGLLPIASPPGARQLQLSTECQGLVFFQKPCGETGPDWSDWGGLDHT